MKESEVKIVERIAYGIRVDIEIECETDDEILAHLSIIRATMKKCLKKEKEINKPITFSDENCYGMHDVTARLMIE